MQAGQTPPVSNEFHSCPQVHNHRSSLRGDQPHSGQRMRGPDGSRLFSFSTSRSGTRVGVSVLGLIPLPQGRQFDGPPSSLAANSPAEGERQQYQDKRFICDSQDLTLHAVLSDGDNTVR